MNFKFLYVIIFFPSLIFAQIDSSGKKYSNINPNSFTDENDTAKTIEKRQSLLHLKSILESHFNNLQFIKPGWENKEDTDFLLYGFTKEELNSGISKNELIAYRKNKDILFKILDDTYKKSWWFRVKSLGQLIGVPDILIKLLEFGLLLM